MKVEKFGMHKGVAAVARQLHVDQGGAVGAEAAAGARGASPRVCGV